MSRRFWTTWPLLCLLACLFVLSVKAPRGWQRLATEVPTADDGPKATESTPQAIPSFDLHPSEEGEFGTSFDESDLLTGSVGRHSRASNSLDEAGSPLEEISCPADAEVAVSSPPQIAPLPQAETAEPPLTAEPLLTLELPALVEPEPENKPVAVESETAQTPEPEAEPAVEVREEVPETIWPKPEALLGRLDELAWDCETGAWARDVALLVRKLARAVADDSDEALMIVAHLNEMAREADPLVAELDREANPLAGKLRRAQHAMGRRLDVWRRVILAGGPSRNPPRPIDAKRLAAAVKEIDAILGASDAGKPWREYFQLPVLGWIAENPDCDADAARRLAATVLRRLTRSRLSADQREFLERKPMIQLAATLRAWLEGPMDLVAVLRHVERVEQEGLASDAQLLADDCRRLLASPEAELRGLGERLDLHYRNANLRAAVTEELINRMMPEREPEFRYVNEEIGGRPVHGRSVTSSEVAVKLIPDERRLRMALEVEGLVSSLTAATAGPATFYNDSSSTYAARKEIELTTGGIFLQPASVEVYSDLQLRDLTTDLDVIPLVGPLIKGIARSQHEQSRPTMNREVERKVAVRAKQQVDSEADARLSKVSQRLRTGLVEPLAALALGPTMVSAQTTDVRMTARLRLGGDDQIGGWTPRPAAPSDSLISFQVHESALNNLLERLGLDDGTFTLAEVRQRVAQRLRRPEMLKVQTENDDVKIRFAATDAARVQCRDGSVCVILSIASLSRSPHRWKDFQVRAYYRPEIRGTSAELVRDGVIRLSGERLNTGAQIALRAIFSKTFSKENTWGLRPEQFAGNPRMAHVGVTQCVIDDGWIGLAYGPTRGEGRPPVIARRADDTDTE